ncbi:hypothetical protein [Burkholderia multivorans]|uniref:hypothetical protein n=1 Tax=Burkholderia multivorans TaxID=87883 RepID=UPI001ED94F45|nr:hypothetical protein [Burkholderia multivorans]
MIAPGSTSWRPKAAIIAQGVSFTSAPGVSITSALTNNPAFPDIPRLRLTAVDQDVTVNGVEINDGDCPLNMIERFPRTIMKGTSDTVDILSSCERVSKAAITTEDGTFNFTFH